MLPYGKSKQGPGTVPRDSAWLRSLAVTIPARTWETQGDLGGRLLQEGGSASARINP
jgi:hypothetical protein